MIRMTKALAEALERLATSQAVLDGSLVEAALDVVAAYRETPTLEGKWEAMQLDEDGHWWIVVTRGNHIDATDQRTAECYRDYLNAADAALEEK